MPKVRHSEQEGYDSSAQSLLNVQSDTSFYPYSSTTSTNYEKELLAISFLRSIPIRVMCLVFLDVIVTIALWVTAGLAMGITPYFSLSVMYFRFSGSLFDLVVISLFKSVFFATVIWGLRSRPLAAYIYGVVMFVTFSGFGYSVLKMAVVLLEDSRYLLGTRGLAQATMAWCLAMSAIQLVAVVLLSMYQNEFGKRGFSYDEKKIAHVEALEIKISTAAYTQEHLAEAAKGEKIAHASLGRLFKLVTPEIHYVVFAFFGLLVGCLSPLAMPTFFGRLIEALSNPDIVKAKEGLKENIIALVVVFIIGAIFSFIREFFFQLVGQKLAVRIRGMALDAILRQDIAFFDITRTGELTNRLSSDTKVIQEAMTTQSSSALQNIVNAVGSIFFLFVISWKLTLVMMATVPVIAVAAVIYARYMKSVNEEMQAALAVASSTAEEAFGAVRTVRSFVREDKIETTYEKDIFASYVVGKKLAFIYGFFIALMGIFAQGAVALVVWYGGTLVLADTMSAGELMSFLLYTLTVALAFAGFSNTIGEFYGAVGAAERIYELIDTVPTIPIEGGYRLEEIDGEITLENVSFQYPSRKDQHVLEGVNIHIGAGQVVALVGPSGSGKSTVVSLIERFYDPTSGIVALDGVDVKRLDPEWYRTKISLVAQEPTLFSGTIKQNILFGCNADLPFSAVEFAAKQANAHEFITSFQDGYDTVVGERGIQLSGGQKQRIAIARALVNDPKVLLLDEATSALDAESEHVVQEAIDKAMKGRTVVVIAHRLSTVKNADKIVVIAHGKVAEEGTHEELLANDIEFEEEDEEDVGKNGVRKRGRGLYRQLVERQLQGMMEEEKERTIFDDVVMTLV